MEEDRFCLSVFGALSLVHEGCAQFSNVQCVRRPLYISSATFPTYFLKAGEDAVQLQSVLDITLFAEQIAPIFGIGIRFARGGAA